jgi:hypothetical protein
VMTEFGRKPYLHKTGSEHAETDRCVNELTGIPPHKHAYVHGNAM